MKEVRQLCAGVKLMRSWERYDIPSNQFYSREPIPIIETPNTFTGSVRGRVAVIGFYGEISGRKYWVTQCQCGTFQLINEKTLGRPGNGSHACCLCNMEEAKRYQEECCALAGILAMRFSVESRKMGYLGLFTDER